MEELNELCAAYGINNPEMIREIASFLGRQIQSEPNFFLRSTEYQLEFIRINTMKWFKIQEEIANRYFNDQDFRKEMQKRIMNEVKKVELVVEDKVW